LLSLEPFPLDPFELDPPDPPLEPDTVDIGIELRVPLNELMLPIASVMVVMEFIIEITVIAVAWVIVTTVAVPIPAQGDVVLYVL
jgi:hypothetical protein